MSVWELSPFARLGMPLGAVDTFPYKIIETTLNQGDAILLMSDGLSELFNELNETFDFYRIKEIFTKIAELPSIEIAKRLFEAGDEWRNEKQQNDDITFVVVKLKEE